MAGTRKAERKKQPAKLRRSRARDKTRRAAAASELARAHDAQAATAEILRVIRSSPADAQPVFDAIVRAAVPLCDAVHSAAVVLEGGLLQLVAHHNWPEPGLSVAQRLFPMPPESDHLTAFAFREARIVQHDHVQDDPAAPATSRELAIATGYRCLTIVPMMRERRALGAIVVTRKSPFTAEQVTLLRTFADQAVIAIENVRLFNEAKEALERQTATADILKVISSSPTDVQPVFDSIAEQAATLCAARFAFVTSFDGEWIHMRATYGPGAEGHRTGYPMRPGSGSIAARVIRDRAAVQVEDMLADPEYAHKEAAASEGFRSGFGVPMLRDGRIFGCIAITRPEPGAMPIRLVHLLQTFADQAVIAIENVRLFNETKEALERQTATAEILKVISSSPTDIQPVLEAVGENAARLCEANNAVIFRLEGGLLRQVAAYGTMPTTSHPAEGLPVDRGRVTGRAVFERRAIHVHDLAAEESEYPEGSMDARRDGHRTTLATPLLRKGVPIGAILIRRLEVRPFSDKQIALLQTFADQAVIAIENVRLFNETNEALEQQTATAEILRVISSTPTNVQPVFDAIVAACARLFPGHQIGVNLVDEQGRVHLRACEGRNRELLHRYFAEQVETRRGTDLSLRRGVAHFSDVEAEGVPAEVRDGCRVWSVKAIVYAPMVSAQRGIGAIWVGRDRSGPFSDKEIALLTTFADQAVIAIQNARLFNETKEALERQTATAEILDVMSRSQTDLQPMFDTIAANAQRLCAGDQALVAVVEGGLVHLASIKAMTPEEEERTRRDWPRPPGRGTVTSRAVLTRTICHVSDVLEDPEYELGHTAQAAGWRSVVSVPMIREGNPVGTITVMRRNPVPFSDAQIALLKTFADQAVIAIENVRLFNETREALGRQTATAEVLKAISQSTFDLQRVLTTLVENATRLCEASHGFVFLPDGATYRLAVAHGASPEFEAHIARIPVRPERGYLIGRVVIERRPVQIVDALADPDYREAESQRLGGYRTMAGVPMLKGGKVVGVIVVWRQEVRAFSDKQIELLTTFADQAVIAIENTRLFKELEARTEALSKSVGQLTALGEVSQAISSTLDFEKVLQTIVERAVQLAELDSGAIYEYEEDRQVFRQRGAVNVDAEIVELFRREPLRLGEGAIGHAGLTREPVQVADMEASYQSRFRELLLRAGWRALLVVPLLSEGRLLGALTVARKVAGEFAPEVIDLLRTFATQSAIAIQNARLFREIEEKGRQLEVASRHKSDFLASMSHELRTPLNAILGFNEMILEGVYGEAPPDMTEPLADIQTSGKHLLRLINNVLDLAKIEAGRMELALADYSVQDVVESVRATLRPLAEAKGLEFLASVPEDLPLAHGDSGRLTQCLMNLAGNSLKFTKAGRVSIAVEQNGGGTLVWRVADTGIGIPMDKIGSLFTQFRQTDATIASEYGGTGLGLSITRKFVEMHGGRIWVESEPGKGSVFIFEVPLRTQAA